MPGGFPRPGGGPGGLPGGPIMPGMPGMPGGFPGLPGGPAVPGHAKVLKCQHSIGYAEGSELTSR